MALRYRKMAEGMAQEVIGEGKGGGNGFKRIGIILSIIVTSFVIGGFVFDWIEGIVKKDITVRQNAELIRALQGQVSILEKEIKDKNVADTKFQAEITEKLINIEESLKTIRHITWKLDKWKEVTEGRVGDIKARER